MVISRWEEEFFSNIEAAFNDKSESKEESEMVDIDKLNSQSEADNLKKSNPEAFYYWFKFYSLIK